MRRIVDTTDGGFDAMPGGSIQVWCMVYIYAGILSGVNDDHIELSEPKVVYETGELIAPEWTDAQPTKGPLRIMKSAIESWGPGR